MINELLAIFDEPLKDKSWIDIYGRLAITGKQKIGNSYKRFPLATQAIDPSCQDMTEYLKQLVPDDTKNGIAFWRSLSNIRYTQIQGIASQRRLKKAEVRLQFVCWLNIRKVSAVNNASNWNEVLNTITKEAVRTLDCQNPKTPTGIDGITNLKVQVTEIGDIDSWKAAMSGYTIENLDALTVWPFAAFTVNCTMTFIAKSQCFEMFEASSEFDATGFCPPDGDKSILITRNATPGELNGYPHYFPLSMLPDDFWDTTDGVLRITDSNGNELPHSVIQMDIPSKTGTLFFKTRKREAAKTFRIHYNPGLEAHGPGEQFGSIAVWNKFDDVILHEGANNVFQVLNHKYNYPSGIVEGFFTMVTAGQLEMNAIGFGDGVFSGVPYIDWASEFQKFSTPKTFLFAFKINSPPPTGTGNLFGNYVSSIDGLFKVDLLWTGSEYRIQVTRNVEAATSAHTTAPGELSDISAGSWIIGALKYEEGANNLELDINGTTRVIAPATITYPVQAGGQATDYQARTGQLNSIGNFFEGALNQILVYDGALTKEERDVFYLNWSDPGTFWTV